MADHTKLVAASQYRIIEDWVNTTGFWSRRSESDVIAERRGKQRTGLSHFSLTPLRIKAHWRRLMADSSS